MNIREKIKKIFKSSLFTIFLIGAIIIVLIIIFQFKGKNLEEMANVPKIKKIVSVESVQKIGDRSEPIKLVGKVMSVNTVDIVALSEGRVEAIFFDVGEKVSKNQTLAFLSNGMASTNLSTAQTSYLNMLSNLDLIRRSADESIRQAEIGVNNSIEAVKLAELSLKSAKDNLNNSQGIQAKGNEDIKENAIITYDDYLNFVKNTLNDINYLIAADAGEQLPGIADSLAAKSTQTLVKAKDDYRLAKNEYLKLKGAKPTTDTILFSLEKLSGLMSLLNVAVKNTVIVLDNTTDNRSFSETQLNAQKSIYNNLLSAVIGTQGSIQASISGLEGIGLNDQKLSDSLSVAVESAERQLEIALVSHESSLSNLERTKQAKDQQLLSAQMSIDNSLGQLNVNRDRFSDLTIKAPIDGQMTKKAVDLGTEVAPGQLIAQVSQTAELKIEINLSSEDVYRVNIGQKVLINNELEGEIALISPVADEITRKVRAEIRFDNKENKLIPGTTVNVEISVSEEKAAEINGDLIFIPLKAINIDQIEKSVFIIVDGRAKKMIIELGEQKGTLVEVFGLTEGDLLVVDGNKTIVDGDEVEIKQ